MMPNHQDHQTVAENFMETPITCDQQMANQIFNFVDGLDIVIYFAVIWFLRLALFVIVCSLSITRSLINDIVPIHQVTSLHPGTCSNC